MFFPARRSPQMVKVYLSVIEQYIEEQYEPAAEEPTADHKLNCNIRYFDEDEDDYVLAEDDEYAAEPTTEEAPPPPQTAPSNGTGARRYSLSLDFDDDPVRDAFYDAFYGTKGRSEYDTVRSMLDRVRDETFSEKVSSLISQKHWRNSKVYKAANLDRRVFSRMMKDPNYKPSKDTAVAIAFALHLNLEQAGDLLSRAGYALSHSDKRDIVIEFFFLNEEYDLMYINLALDELGERPIGYKC